MTNSCKRNLLYIVVAAAFACNGKPAKDTTATAGTADTLLGRQVRLTDGLEAYTNAKDSLYMDSAAISNTNGFRIYAFVNVSCSSCIPDIDKWNLAAREFRKYNVPVVLIGFTKNSFEYLKFLIEDGKLKNFPYPIFLDGDGRFFSAHPFISREVAHQAVLVDNKNTIVATGSPIESGEVKALYLQKITNQ